MPDMHIPIPLVGMDPSSQGGSERRGRFASEERSMRFVSEGELFYVDTDVDDSFFGANRHDHGHLGGLPFEDITRFMASQKLVVEGHTNHPESSSSETEPASRTTSQESTSSIGSWKMGNEEESDTTRRALAKAAGQTDDVQCRESTQRLPGDDLWDFSRNLSTIVVARIPADESESFSTPHEPPKSPSALRPRFSSPICGEYDTGGGNVFDCILGSRIEDVARNWHSSTAMKTFEVSSGAVATHLAQLGVAVDQNFGPGPLGFVTFTSNILHFR